MRSPNPLTESFQRPEHQGQLYYEDIERLSEDSEILLHSKESICRPVWFLHLSDVWVTVYDETEYGKVSFLCSTPAYGLIPDNDNIWCTWYWITFPEDKLLWQEVGF